jgi:hypothetical protein
LGDLVGNLPSWIRVATTDGPYAEIKEQVGDQSYFDRLRLSLLHRPEECAILQQPSVGGVAQFFDKKQIAKSNWQMANAFWGFGVSLHRCTSAAKAGGFYRALPQV